ncbi:CFF_collapsed_G0044880.mRNA.1.CDS.1 [Saccharomyces cerevisiae]|nr:CFF_collapsed_G0044880.mRNA.1.CDS.1 [Saccharomyces cerevisiae]
MSYSFLDFGLTKLNIFSSPGIDIYFCPEGVFTQSLMQGLSKDVQALCLLGLARKYRIRGIAWEA